MPAPSPPLAAQSAALSPSAPDAAPGLEAALSAALAEPGAPRALGLLRQLAPLWYRQARHAELVSTCARLGQRIGSTDWPADLALWQALSNWYLAPQQARDQLLALACRQDLDPPGLPRPDAPLADELYLLAALYRAELALLATPARLAAIAQAIEARLALPARQSAPTLVQLGGVTAALAAHSAPGHNAARIAQLSAESLALVARLDDRHSLCSAVALARWPLLRGEPALARETCELITVGLLAGDDAHMPLAHGWLMAVQAELARPGSFDLLRAWSDGSMDRVAMLASPIAPMLLSALALLDAQAPRQLASDVQVVVLSRQEHWTPFERWVARAARCWAHLRDGDVPAARALLRLLRADPMPPDALPGCYATLLEQQADMLAGAGTAAAADTPARPGWPGPTLLAHLVAWAQARRSPTADELAECDQAWRQHGLVLPLFAVPAVVEVAVQRVLKVLPQAAASPWLQAVQAAVALHTRPAPTAESAATPTVEIRLLDGLRIAVDGAPLPLGRKPPRRLLELTALLALRAPAEQPAARLADALYPELEGDAALHALDTALYRLRRLLPAGALRRGATGIALDPALVQVRRDGPAARWLPEFDQPWAVAARSER
jgi:hypothetical protein